MLRVKVARFQKLFKSHNNQIRGDYKPNVVECCCFLIIIIVGARIPRSLYFVHQRRRFFHKMLFTVGFWDIPARGNLCCCSFGSACSFFFRVTKKLFFLPFCEQAIVRRGSPAPLFAHLSRILTKVAFVYLRLVCILAPIRESKWFRRVAHLYHWWFLFHRFCVFALVYLSLEFISILKSTFFFSSYFVHQRRRFRSGSLAGVARRRISSINVVIFCIKCYSRWGFGILCRDGIIVAG